MSFDIVKEIFVLLENFFSTYQSPGDVIDFLSNSLHYFNTFILYIKPITYFVPKAHFVAILSFAISSINLRILIALYRLFNPFK